MWMQPLPLKSWRRPIRPRVEQLRQLIAAFFVPHKQAANIGLSIAYNKKMTPIFDKSRQGFDVGG